MAIKNYTTAVNESRTIGEIMGLLSAKGAASIQIHYGDGMADGISFAVLIGDRPMPFKLPCNFAGVQKCLLNEYAPRNRYKYENDPDLAKRARNIAWRNLKDWIAAQMAFIETEQAQLAEVFLPYAVDNRGMTVFQGFLEQHQRALPAAEVEVG